MIVDTFTAVFSLATLLLVLLATWVATWPLWLQVLLVAIVGPVMVVHFLVWAGSHIARRGRDR
jgi:putative Mn2+ efflux pump MntP